MRWTSAALKTGIDCSRQLLPRAVNWYGKNAPPCLLGGMIGHMRRAIYAALVACVFTAVPIFILKLNSETSIVNLLKTIAAALGVPGAFIGLIVAFGRVHDIDLWVTAIGNFAFYFVVAWLLLKAFGRTNPTKREAPRQAHASWSHPRQNHDYCCARWNT